MRTIISQRDIIVRPIFDRAANHKRLKFTHFSNEMRMSEIASPIRIRAAHDDRGQWTRSNAALLRIAVLDAAVQGVATNPGAPSCAAVSVALMFAVGPASVHCDGLDGPVVTVARKANHVSGASMFDR